MGKLRLLDKEIRELSEVKQKCCNLLGITRHSVKTPA